MDDAGRLRGFHAAQVGPGAGLVGPGGEECFEVEQFVGRFDQARHARLLQPQVFEEHLPLVEVFQFGDVGLRGGGDDEHFGPLAGDGLPDGLGVGVTRRGALFVDVADVQHGLVGQQVEVGDQFAVLLVEFHGAGRKPLFQHRLVLQEQLHGALGLLVAARGGLLLGLGEPVLDGFEILQLQFGVDDALVAHGVYRAVDVGDVAVVEAPQDVDDRIRVADVAQKFVAQTFALRGALHEARDVDDFDRRRDHALGVVDLREADQPPVGDRDHAHIRLDGAERKVCRLCLCIGQAVEKGRFTHVRQADDAAL